MTRSILLWMACCAVVATAMMPGRATGSEESRSATETSGWEENFFEQKVRPILAEACFTCHSSQAVRVRAGLLLDSRQGILQGGDGGTIIVPGDLDRSRLIEAIRWTNADFQMPPQKPLDRTQIETLERWVAMGAPLPEEGPSTGTTGTDMATADTEEPQEQLWSLQPIVRPEVPVGFSEFKNPIDAFIAAQQQSKKLMPVGRADRATLLRRVYLDLIGIPPTPDEQHDFLNDPSEEAYEKVVDRLLASEQHGVRYARHWLDVFRYADVDERMLAARGIYLWRDWMIHALNDDLPYDQFIRAQLTGYRSTNRTQMSATGYRSKAEPRPDDLFALGLLSRGAVIRDGQQEGELAISAVETISSALMGLTVACAKCHDHVYDPITQRNYYEMKALFDPLIPRRIMLATADERFASAQAAEVAAERRRPIAAQIDALVEPYKKKLYDERVAMLPLEVQAVILKPERQRTAAEQKIADDYFPILRIDGGKIFEILPEQQRTQLKELERQLKDAEPSGDRRRTSLAEFWTVEVDPKKETEASYVLTSGDPERPERNREVKPGWPFAPESLEFREGRVEAFSDWLTAPENPLFARVAVNRIWQWHFGEGLHKTPSDLGKFAGVPSHPELLDWLASEFIRSGFSMRAMHRLIVTSETYQRTSLADPTVDSFNREIDPNNTLIWHFPLQRLDAETIWDSLFAAANGLDLTVGGPSFSAGVREEGRERRSGSVEHKTTMYRRAAYLTRGYSTNREVMAHFLQTFDVDDGRVSCPQRTQTVTATQGLFLMNSEEMELATTRFAERLAAESHGDLAAAVELGYRIALARSPTEHERQRAMEYLQQDASRLKGFAWLLFNLDEFIYVR